jgi:hypothetical protein
VPGTSLKRNVSERSLTKLEIGLTITTQKPLSYWGGFLTEAAETFDEVKGMVVARPDSYRAVILQHIARSYFESSYFDLAVVNAQKSAATYELAEAHFELGVFLIAAGRFAEADSVFREVKCRFGTLGHARNLLAQLVTHDVQRDAAKRAIEMHFPGDANGR